MVSHDVVQAEAATEPKNQVLLNDTLRQIFGRQSRHGTQTFELVGNSGVALIKKGAES